MSRYIEGYKQGYKDGMAGAALPNVNDNGDKIDGYSYEYKTDSNGEPYIHIDSVRSMLKKAADVQPVKRGKWIWSNSPEFGNPYGSYICSECESSQAHRENFCPDCGARMDGETNYS